MINLVLLVCKYLFSRPQASYHKLRSLPLAQNHAVQSCNGSKLLSFRTGSDQLENRISFSAHEANALTSRKSKYFFTSMRIASEVG